MNDYKKYLVRQLGLKEAQFVPFVREDEHPDIDPEAQMQPDMSPTAIPTPIIAVGIRGSLTGGLPSGADKEIPDLAPTNLGGYDRVSPEDLNTKLVNKTPPNPEIKQQNNPINQNPSTGQGITHPHQMQVTYGEEPQLTTGASTDSDDTLKLTSAEPKGIDIDIPGTEKEPDKEEENPMIPVGALGETFERHKKLALEVIRRHSESKETDECATCGCGDPDDTHGHGNLKNEGFKDDLRKSQKPVGGSSGKEAELRRKIMRGVTKKLKGGNNTDKKDMENDKQDLPENVECQKCHQNFDFNLVAEVAMGAVKCPACNSIINQEGQALFESKHKADCECGFCMNKGSFGKKKEKDMSDEGKESEEEEKNLDENTNDKNNPRTCGICGMKHPCACDMDDIEKEKFKRQYPDKYREKVRKSVGGRTDKPDKPYGLTESYSPPFSRMRGLAGLGKVILASNGNWTDTTVKETNMPGAANPFVTHWKMDKEKAGMVKIDEAKLQKIYETLHRKSKRGTLSERELLLTKRISEVLKKRGMIKEETEEKSSEKSSLEDKLADLKKRKDSEKSSADHKNNMDRLEKEKRRDDLA